MNPKDFIDTLYLGDRACKGLWLDTWNKRLALHVNLISRVRSASGMWDFYRAEDIAEGRIVFTGVQSFQLEPPGPLPNDEIFSLEVERLQEGPADPERYLFTASIGSIDDLGNTQELTLKIVAEGIHLEDPQAPGREIRD